MGKVETTRVSENCSSVPSVKYILHTTSSNFSLPLHRHNTGAKFEFDSPTFAAADAAKNENPFPCLLCCCGLPVEGIQQSGCRTVHGVVVPLVGWPPC